MRNLPLTSLPLFAALILIATACRQAPGATADEVDEAIRKGVEYLYSRPDFKKNGNWEEAQKRADAVSGASQSGAQWGGRTALMTYALLASGESPNDSKLRPAIEFLKKSDDMIGFYALGLRPQVWLYLPQDDSARTLAARDFRMLWAGIKKDMSRSDGGLYDYTINDRERIDLSVSQYGVLGAWACAQLGIEVPAGDGRASANYWQLVERRWRMLQDAKTGGWAYSGDSSVSASMTAAGVATLFITQDYLRGSQGVNCQGNQRSPEIEKGIAYLEQQLPAIFGDAAVPERHYTIYGIERIGVASGLKYLNHVDWYQTGAEYLVRTQEKNGSWKGDHDDEIPTAFALLFLSRGREPVVMNKLKYDIALPKADAEPLEGFWNQRSRDVANATRFIARQTERSLNWQIIDMNLATIRDLRDAPIAYISGSQALRFKAEQLALLKQYVEEGGMIVFNVDCGRSQFARSIPPMLTDIFPGSEFKPLPDTHVIYKNQQFRADKWKKRPSVQGLSNGVRELALVFDEDLGKSFQTNEITRAPYHFELMTDIYQYAIDKKNSLVKGRSYVVERNPGITVLSTIKLARLDYGGKWDPEPGGWRQLAAVMHNRHNTDLQVNTVKLETGDLAGYHAAHLTGVQAIKLSDAAVKKLSEFVKAGGLLVVDAAGGSSEFASSIEQQLGKILDTAKDAGGPLIPPTDPIFTVKGMKVPEFRYRTFAQATVGISTSPRLHGAKVGERYGVIYSADDLSAGIVGNEVDGVRGYTPSVATDIMIRLLRYSQDAPTGRAGTQSTTKPARAAVK
jgi:hypothetical protein